MKISYRPKLHAHQPAPEVPEVVLSPEEEADLVVASANLNVSVETLKADIALREAYELPIPPYFAARLATLKDYAEGRINATEAMQRLDLEHHDLLFGLMNVYGLKRAHNGSSAYSQYVALNSDRA